MHFRSFPSKREEGADWGKGGGGGVINFDKDGHDCFSLQRAKEESGEEGDIPES